MGRRRRAGADPVGRHGHGRPRRGVLAELGFSGDDRMLAAASGTLAAGVLAWGAHRDRDLAQAFLAVASLAVGVGSGWAVLDPSGGVDLIAVASIFAVVEAVALVAERDPFWRRPAAYLADVAEVVTGFVVVLFGAVLVLLAAIDAVGPDAASATALAVLAGGWLAAGLRRRSAFADLGAGLSAVGTVSGSRRGRASPPAPRCSRWRRPS